MAKTVLSNKGWRAALASVATASLVFGTVVGVGGHMAQVQAQTGGFANPSFQRVWERTDAPVAQGRVNRTWVWGPAPGRSMQEPFREGPNGTHLVQYFDKARMEINDPRKDSTDPFYVTNGLLVVEMISGRKQVGVNDFETSVPSDQVIAGDAGSDAPTYAALRGIASVGLPGQPNRARPITPGNGMPSLYINRQGVWNEVPPHVVPASMKVAAYVNETGHNIPDVFWEYLNSTGVVYEGGQYVTRPLFNWVSAFGYPVTEAYWTRIKVSGGDRLVLFQAFQRRILTYSPSNPLAWQIEMGNVGAQYYSWRYENPTISCARVPVRGFGRIWAQNRNVQRGIGCPVVATYGPQPGSQELALDTAYQPFERGAMVWISATVPYQTRYQFIYTFFDDGTFQQFDDTWRPGQPESGGLTPPAGKYEPVRGFGKVWREGTGARVRERLGWATAPEKGGPGAYQKFDRGEMYWSGAVNKIWVLYGTANNFPYPGYPYPAPVPTATTGGGSPFRYEVYDDTFTP